MSVVVFNPPLRVYMEEPASPGLRQTPHWLVAMEWGRMSSPDWAVVADVIDGKLRRIMSHETIYLRLKLPGD